MMVRGDAVHSFKNKQMILKEVKKAGFMAFSPVAAHANIVIIAGNTDKDMFLEVAEIVLSDRKTELSTIISFKFPSYFTCLKWATLGKSHHAERYPSGLIFGGLASGGLLVFDPRDLIQKKA